VAQKMKRGALLALIFRRNAFVSSAYRRFQAELVKLGCVEKIVEVDRRLRPKSGAAESVLLLFRARARNSTCKLQTNLDARSAYEDELLHRGWRPLKSIARVLAGPSVKNEVK